MRKQRVVGRIYGMKYSWKAIKTEIGTRTESKEVSKLGWFCQKHKLQHPQHVKVSQRDWRSVQLYFKHRFFSTVYFVLASFVIIIHHAYRQKQEYSDKQQEKKKQQSKPANY